MHDGLQTISNQSTERLGAVENRVQRITEDGLAAVGLRTQQVLRASKRLSAGRDPGIGIGVRKPGEDVLQSAFRLNQAAEARAGRSVSHEAITVTAITDGTGSTCGSSVARSALNGAAELSRDYHYAAQQGTQALHIHLDETQPGSGGAEIVDEASTARPRCMP